jgi:hypothetical protein
MGRASGSRLPTGDQCHHGHTARFPPLPAVLSQACLWSRPPFPTPYLQESQINFFWHKLFLMSPVPSKSLQTLRSNAGNGMTYGPQAPDTQLPLMALDTSRPPKSIVTEQPGELPSPLSLR